MANSPPPKERNAWLNFSYSIFQSSIRNRSFILSPLYQKLEIDQMFVFRLLLFLLLQPSLVDVFTHLQKRFSPINKKGSCQVAICLSWLVYIAFYIYIHVLNIKKKNIRHDIIHLEFSGNIWQTHTDLSSKKERENKFCLNAL